MMRVLHKQRHGTKDIIERKDVINILEIESTGLKIHMHGDDFSKG